jgi:hypothetical protein
MKSKVKERQKESADNKQKETDLWREDKPTNIKTDRRAKSRREFVQTRYQH